MPTLIIKTGKHRGQKLVLTDAEVVFGRDDDCQIQLASSDVSRRHCAIRPSPEGMLVRDLGSHNGTLVNDVAIEEETLLEPGDALRVGPMLFEVAGKKDADEPPGTAGPQPGKTKVATDDAIVDWLTGDEPGETTSVPSEPPDEPVAEPEPESKPARIPPKKESMSVAEEAADIIRRHWEIVDQKERKKKGQ